MTRQSTTRSALITGMTAAALLLSGCTNGMGNKEVVGTMAGAALGGWGGSQIGHGEGRGLAIATGIILGGLFGNQIGKGLDKTDRLEAERTSYRALEYNRSGQSSSWHNPDSGHSGSFTPRPAYQSQNGQYCREYTQTIHVAGERQTAVGTACRQSDGTWKVVG